MSAPAISSSRHVSSLSSSIYTHLPISSCLCIITTKNRHITLLLSCQHPYVYVINIEPKVMMVGAKKQRTVQASSRKGCMRGKGGPENASCTYKGVRQRTWGKWVAEIREPNRGARLWLGTFDSSREAALAYDSAARKLYGPEAHLNLPEPVRSYPETATSQTTPSSNTGGKSSDSESPCSSHEMSSCRRVTEEISWEHINVDLPVMDDSSIWEEATMSLGFPWVREADDNISRFDSCIPGAYSNWDSFHSPL